MAEDMLTVDISDTPTLVHLVEEVRRTQTPYLLQRDGEDVALLLPVPTHSPHKENSAKTLADYEAFRQAAGSWQDVDTE